MAWLGRQIIIITNKEGRHTENEVKSQALAVILAVYFWPDSDDHLSSTKLIFRKNLCCENGHS